jgi:putative ATP-binding cassette transporter
MFATASSVWKRFVMLGRPFFRSEVRWQAVGLLVLLVVLLLGVSSMNVVNSFLGRDFMTAVAQRELGRFYVCAVLYAAGFVLATVVAVFYRFTEERLGLLWRQWLTGHLTDRYLSTEACERINRRGDIDNPDQRIAEDLRNVTTNSLSLLLILLNSTLTLFAFSGILWSISPWLFVVGAGYAACGSLVTVFLGRRLLHLNVIQLRKEADLRYELIRAREQCGRPGAASGSSWAARVGGRVQGVVENMRRIIGVNRNLGFFTTGYNYMIQIIPILIVAPLYIAGKIEFGQVTQAAMAFSHVLGAFSLLITEFGRITTFAAEISRLGTLCDALDETACVVEQAPAEVAAEPALVAQAG